MSKNDVMNEIIDRVNAFRTEVKEGKQDARGYTTFLTEMMDDICEKYKARFSRDTCFAIYGNAVKYFKH